MADRLFGGGGGRSGGKFGGGKVGGRTFGGGGGGGGFTLSFPPFRGAVRGLILANVAVYFAMLLIGLFSGRLVGFLETLLALIPALTVRGYIWQIATYAFLHDGIWHIAGNMLQLWFFGTTLESSWGRKHFYEFFFFSVIGGALLTVALAFTGWFGMVPTTATLGASGGVFGVLVAFAMIYGEQEVYLFPFPISIRAKYLVVIMVLINLAGALGAMRGQGQLIAYAAHLGGALFGWIYVKFLPSRGLGFATSEGYYGIRNSFYKWKRRRAAKKFEVYMRKHDRGEYFDEYGNYKAPDDKDKENGGTGRGGWVN